MLVCIAVSILLVFYAAICNAKMDTVKDHWSTSTYAANASNDPQWFNPAISWTNKDNKDAARALQLKYLPELLHFLVILKPGWDPVSDFWHWQKTQMLWSLFLAGAVALLSGYTVHSVAIDRIFIALSYTVFCGVTWILTFNWFYNKILKK